MRGTIGLLVGIAFISLGLTGLGVTLAQMMTHADPHGAFVSIGGLGVFLVGCVFMLMLASR